MVAETPCSEPRLFVVLPLYKELSNGNLARVIRCFLDQTATDFALVCVISNAPEESGNPIWQENLETVRVLREPPPGSIFAEARRRGLQWIVLDHTQGLERNIGNIRDLGAQEAIRRGATVLAMLDADSLVPPNYVETILREFSQNRLSSLFLSMRWIPQPGGSPELYRTHARDIYWSAWETFYAILLGEAIAGFASPQIVVTAAALQKVGGVPKLPKREDVRLAELLTELGDNKRTSDLWVITQDRARVEGFSAARRLHELNENIEPGWVTPHTDPLRAMLQKALERLPATASAAVVRRVYGFYGFAEGELPPESGLFAEVHPDLRVIDFYRSHLPDEEFAALAEEISLRAQEHDASARLLANLIERGQRSGHPFLDGNEWVETYPREKLVTDFPDWFLPYPETPVQQRNLRLYALIAFLNRARSQPTRFPVTHRLDQAIRGQLEITPPMRWDGFEREFRPVALRNLALYDRQDSRIALLERIGFDWRSPRVPTVTEFVAYYEQRMREHIAAGRVSPQDVLHPARIFRLPDGSLVPVPIEQEAPPEARPCRERIRARDFARLAAQGFFPIGDCYNILEKFQNYSTAEHDLFEHFLAFSEYPEYAAEVRRTYSALHEAGEMLPRERCGLSDRMYMALELLVVAEPCDLLDLPSGFETVDDVERHLRGRPLDRLRRDLLHAYPLCARRVGAGAFGLVSSNRTHFRQDHRSYNSNLEEMWQILRRPECHGVDPVRQLARFQVLWHESSLLDPVQWVREAALPQSRKLSRMLCQSGVLEPGHYYYGPHLV